MVTISEVKGNSRENRTAAHTHIKGLGLRSDGYAEDASAGFVGQAAAREVRTRYHLRCPMELGANDHSPRLAAWW